MFQQWYTAQIQLLCNFLSERLDHSLHLYQCTCLAHVVKRDHAQESPEQSPGLGHPSQQGGGGHSNGPSVGLNQTGVTKETVEQRGRECQH
uniref:MUN domain-containing protein n=1 Tax=Timema bartmani TaxID=61472 RepID=A0A7R9F894_9NEOP|nr:unnamed protein product [Timema bartmani]